MATTMKLIAKQILSTTAASVSFTGIPGTFSDLSLLATARSNTNGSGVDYFFIRFNGVSTNLSGRSLYAQNSSTVVSITFAPYGRLTESTFTANTFASTSIYIPNYAGNTNKSFSVDTAQENNSTAQLIDIVAGLWSSTAAITQVDLVPNVGSFASGSSFFLYGINKA